MRWLIVILLITSSIIEATLFSFPLTLCIVAVIAILTGTRFASLLFLTGIVLDLFAMRTIGQASLFFLITCWVSSRYQRKIYLGQLFTTTLFVATTIVIYDLIFRGYFKLNNVFGGVLIASLVMLMVNRFFIPPQKGKPLLS